MHDNLLIYLFWDFKKHRASGLYRKFNQKVIKYPNINNYLLNRYKDSESRIESLLRLVYNIENRPRCPICGNLVKFIGKPNSKGIFSIHCSEECRRKDINSQKVKQTKLLKYGNENYNNSEQVKQTKLLKYGNENYNNSEQIKQTKLLKYGNSGYNNIEQIKQTCLKKYSDPNFNNREKAKQTCLEKYNAEYYINQEKMINTKIEKYGNAWGDPNKIKQTKLEKYGTKNYVNIEKIKQTKLERYGNSNFNNINKAKQTCLKKYGVIHISKLQWIVDKINNTKKEHNSYNKSEPEDKSYILLKEKYNNVIRQYKSDIYPFNCDFYIPNLDLYIECNYMWTHGKFPYIETNQKCIDKLNIWKYKSLTSDFYKSAIDTWTIRDVKKRNIAKENNLNWIEFFNINELKTWLTKN